MGLLLEVLTARNNRNKFLKSKTESAEIAHGSGQKIK